MGKRNRKKIKTFRVILTFVIFSLICYGIFYLLEDKVFNKEKLNIMADLSNYTKEEVIKYAKDNNLNVDFKYEHNNDFLKGKIINQGIKKGTNLIKGQPLLVTISLGVLPKDTFEEKNVDELGYIPVMMYHGINHMNSSETKYYGGNVDKDGYNRTTEAFINDLEFYYQSGYRMIRLIDYVESNIDTELGYSPIVLTFDDGNVNNIKVTGLDNKGNIIIDENSAVGILESFKKKYRDFNVTATFFLNDGLFGQPQYNEKILKWLIENGYDIGNHTKGHVNFSNIDASKTQSSIASIYQQFDEIIPNKYVKIVALPFGSPYKKTHTNFPYILKGEYNGYKYETVSTLQVGWTYNPSCYSRTFDKEFIMRIRAWDTDTNDVDIKKTFKLLTDRKYISDGDKSTIVTKENKKDIINNIYDKEVILY